MYNIDDFKQEYGEYDPDEIVDILNLSTEEILERFEDKIEEYIARYENDEQGENTEN